MRQQTFVDIYHDMRQHGYESVSGHGSNLAETRVLRRELAGLLRCLRVKTLLDAPCGDYHWMPYLHYDIEFYIGWDIVPEIIASNPHATDRVFEVHDIVRDVMPAVDFVLCRDCLVHLTLLDAMTALQNIMGSHSRWMALTTYPGIEANEDVATGGWRPLNLQLPPFSLSRPDVLIDEEGEGADAGKCLGVWQL